MDLYQKQQFGFFLQTATERFVARLEERFRGADGALKQFTEDADSQTDSLRDFVDAVFEDFLLNNIEGACFILQALPTRNVEASNGTVTNATVESTLTAMAKQLFSQLLIQKTIESLEQRSSYQSV